MRPHLSFVVALAFAPLGVHSMEPMPQSMAEMYCSTYIFSGRVVSAKIVELPQKCDTSNDPLAITKHPPGQAMLPDCRSVELRVQLEKKISPLDWPKRLKFVSVYKNAYDTNEVDLDRVVGQRGTFLAYDFLDAYPTKSHFKRVVAAGIWSWREIETANAHIERMVKENCNIKQAKPGDSRK